MAFWILLREKLNLCLRLRWSFQRPGSNQLVRRGGKKEIWSLPRAPDNFWISVLFISIFIFILIYEWILLRWWASMLRSQPGSGQGESGVNYLLHDTEVPEYLKRQKDPFFSSFPQLPQHLFEGTTVPFGIGRLPQMARQIYYLLVLISPSICQEFVWTFRESRSFFKTKRCMPTK